MLEFIKKEIWHKLFAFSLAVILWLFVAEMTMEDKF